MQTVDVLYAIDEIDPQEWDAVCSNRAFVTHRWLRLAESVLAEYEPRYLLVRRQGRLVAAAIGTLEHQFRNPTLQAKAGWILRAFPCLRIAMPMMATSGLLVHSDGGEELGALLEAIHAFVKRQRISFYTLDHLAVQHPVWALAPQRNYRQLAMLPETHLDIAWASYEDYLAALPRKKRKEIGRMERHAIDEGIVVQPIVPSPENSTVLDQLVGNLLHRYGETNRYAPNLFLRAATVLGDDLTILSAQRNGQLVGCTALLRSGNEVSAKWIGRDYARTAETAVYYAMVAGCVRQSIEMGAQRLHLGAAAYETKKQFGVGLEAQNEAFATRSQLLNWGLGKARRLKSAPDTQNRA
ncbi:MAG: GNAT family N-acetyltransferase [Caldilineaceae bacterium]